METHISPKEIQERVDAMATASSATPVETPAPAEKPADSTPAPTPEAKPEPKVEVKPEPKTEEKVEPKVEKKQPNDPGELRKWATKAAQEAAAAHDVVKALKAAIEKMSKKPVDYKELAKDPEALRKHVEAERQEAISEMQQLLTEERNNRVQQETINERRVREQDTENYPRWTELFPLIQSMAANQDGRVNFNQPVGTVLDELYRIADQSMPTRVAAPTPAPAPVAPAAPVKSAAEIEAEIQARVAAATAEIEKKALEKAQVGLRNEANGAGIASAGKGGRRDPSVSKDAFMKMDLKDLKAFIQKES